MGHSFNLEARIEFYHGIGLGFRRVSLLWPIIDTENIYYIKQQTWSIYNYCN